MRIQRQCAVGGGNCDAGVIGGHDIEDLWSADRQPLQRNRQPGVVAQEGSAHGLSADLHHFRGGGELQVDRNLEGVNHTGGPTIGQNLRLREGRLNGIHRSGDVCAQRCDVVGIGGDTHGETLSVGRVCCV